MTKHIQLKRYLPICCCWELTIYNPTANLAWRIWVCRSKHRQCMLSIPRCAASSASHHTIISIYSTASAEYSGSFSSSSKDFPVPLKSCKFRKSNSTLHPANTVLYNIESYLNYCLASWRVLGWLHTGSVFFTFAVNSGCGYATNIPFISTQPEIESIIS